jgi:hypothetical protein
LRSAPAGHRPVIDVVGVIAVIVEVGSPPPWADVVKAAAPNGQPVVVRHGRNSWVLAPPGISRKGGGRARPEHAPPHGQPCLVTSSRTQVPYGSLALSVPDRSIVRYPVSGNRIFRPAVVLTASSG